MFGRKSKFITKVISPDRGFDSFEMRLGDEMRGERATMGKSLMDVQRELRIRASYIAAIENADLSAFDSQSFVAGYVRSYARYLNMDPEIVFARFCEESGFGGISALKPMESEITRRDTLGALPGLGAVASGAISKASAKKPKAPVDPLMGSGNPFANKATPVFAGFEPGALGSLAVLALLIGGLGYGGWTLVQEIQRVQVAPVEQAPELVAELDPLAPSLPQRATPEVVGVDIAAPNEALSRLYRPQALDAPILTARDAPIASINPGRTAARDVALASAAVGANLFADLPQAIDGALIEALGEAPGTTPQVLASAPDAVVIVAARNAWIRVRTADGEELLQRELAAGETFEIPATDSPVSLRTGNTGAVFFSVAGQTYGPIAPGAQVLTTDISASLVTESYALTDLTDDSDIARVVAELAAEPALPGSDTAAD